MKPPIPIHEVNSESERPLPPGCAEARRALHERLDGIANVDNAVIRQHTEVCADCKAYAEAGRILLGALAALPKLIVPSGFAERVLARDAAMPYHPWFKRWTNWAAAFATAACVFIAILIMRNMRPDIGGSGYIALAVPPAPVENPPVAIRESKPTGLGDSIQQAGVAVGALTRRATNEGFGLRMPNLQMPKANVDPVPKVDPALASLQDIRQGAVLSIAPITDSARRAFGAFMRELGPEMDAKPANN